MYKKAGCHVQPDILRPPYCEEAQASHTGWGGGNGGDGGGGIVGVVMVAEVAVGCGLDLPGSSGAVGRGGQFILSGEAQGGSCEARCHARRREGWPDVTSRTVCGRGVWFGARLGLGRRGACGFNCC